MRDCDTFEANARNIIFPPEQWTASYAEGAIRFIALDVGEPACCGLHLMVLNPDPEMGFQQCTLISHSGNLGFGTLDLPARSAGYDPATGLTVAIPVGLYDGQDFQAETLFVTVNQATGEVAAR